jgi:predicted metal-dependent enzyme (double-stranded beta helix superfamily)
MMSVSTKHSDELEQLYRQLQQPTLADAVAALSSLVHQPTFWHTQVQSLLQERLSSPNLTIARTLGTQANAAVLQLLAWPPGSQTQIHDHACWGAWHCVAGSLLEERYERLDDSPRPDTAHLRLCWQRPWTREAGVSTFLPYEAGIHRLSNPAGEVAISLHIYGPRLNRPDGRDNEATCNYVCDRFAVDDEAPVKQYQTTSIRR